MLLEALESNNDGMLCEAVRLAVESRTDDTIRYLAISEGWDWDEIGIGEDILAHLNVGAARTIRRMLRDTKHPHRLAEVVVYLWTLTARLEKQVSDLVYTALHNSPNEQKRLSPPADDDA
jgi:hypothetical protein